MRLSSYSPAFHLRFALDFDNYLIISTPCIPIVKSRQTLFSLSPPPPHTEGRGSGKKTNAWCDYAGSEQPRKASCMKQIWFEKYRCQKLFWIIWKAVLECKSLTIAFLNPWLRWRLHSAVLAIMSYYACSHCYLGTRLTLPLICITPDSNVLLKLISSTCLYSRNKCIGNHNLQCQYLR